MRNHSIETEQLFHFNTTDLRTAIRDDGECLFSGKDVCAVLGIKNTGQAVQKLDDDERHGVTTSDTTGRDQEMIFITESGLYTLIFSSRKPEAQKFRKWVTGEVLPNLRKKGFYGRLPIHEMRLWRKMRIDLLVKIAAAKDPAIKLQLLTDLTEVSQTLGMETTSIRALMKQYEGPTLTLI